MHDNRRVCILMASFPHRHKLMLSAVNQLISQCDDFYLWLNQYNTVPEELLEFKDKLHVKVNVSDLKDNGRYTFLDECKDDYCFICDDDISWPEDYVDNTLKCFDRNGNNIVTAYFIHGRQDFVNEYQNDEVIKCNSRSFGSGTCAFIPSVLQCNITRKELDSGYDCEIFFATACERKGISLVSPKRPANFLSWNHIGDAHSNDMFALHNNGCNDRRTMTFNYIKSTGMHSAQHKITYDQLASMSFMIDTGQVDHARQVFKYHNMFMPQNIVVARPESIVKCHYDAIRYAQKHHWPFALVFEDTAYPIENARQNLKECIQSLNSSCGALVLGNIEFETGQRFGKFIKFKKNKGYHAYIVFEQCYDDFLSHEVDLTPPDEVLQTIDSRLAYEKCLFIQMHKKDGKVEYVCKNREVVSQCPAFDEIMSWNKFLSQNVRVANVTNLSDWNNYGQRLQTYALQQFIKKNFNVDMFTLDTRSFYTTFGKSHCFHEFERQHVNFVKIRSFNDYRLKNVDIVLVGGDQNWNSYNEHYNGKHYDSFAKLVSYSSSAASGKLDRIDSSSENQIRQLSKFKMLSFREKSTSVSMANELKKRGRKTSVSYHIDPVFLLDKDEWMKIAKKPSFVKDDEVFDFQYSIGNKRCTSIEENGVRRHICYGNNNNLNNMTIENFLWMMMNCKRLFTSSFHGTAFGILFNKLIVIDNNKVNDMRIKNLASMFNLKIQNGYIDARCKDKVQDVIHSQKQRSFEWLQKCISVDDIKYACYTKDKNIRDMSASGGASAKLAQHVIEQGGVVYGAAYAKDFKSVETTCVDNMNDYFSKISKSKYSISKMPDIDDVKDKLESGKLVLFTGCPCQIVKLKSMLGKHYDNFMTVDLLCNGCSRPEFLQQFVQQQERQHNAKITGIDMRHDHSSSLKISFNDGTSKVIENGSRQAFVCHPENYIEDCKSCKMHAHGHGEADITLGDFWEYNRHRDLYNQEFSPLKGTSIVFINTLAGLKLFDSIKNEMNFKYVCS